jgi:superfamily II DNA or RNA helicase
MPDVQLTEAFFQKTAGWEAVRHARLLLAGGHVLSSNWTPPLLKGVVQAGETSYRAGLVIRGEIDIENLCTCRQSREVGSICPHAVAVGLHWLKPPAAPSTSPTPSNRLSPPAPSPSPARPTRPTRDPVRLRRDPRGTPLPLHVILPPNFTTQAAAGRVVVVLEGAGPRGRAPLNSFVSGGPWQLDPTDAALLDLAEEIAGGDTPGMMQPAARDLGRLLVRLAGHPRVTLGRQAPLHLDPTPAALPLRATLEANGEIVLALAPLNPPPQLLPLDPGLWLFRPGPPAHLAPLALSASLQGVLQKPLRIPRTQVPVFLSTDWPSLAAAPGFQANFQATDFTLAAAAPRFVLELAGGLAQLSALLQCRYGSRIMTVGVTRPDEAAWLPDPADPRRYGTRDLGAEHVAFQRLRTAGFTGPDGQGRWQMAGQDRVLGFFAREYTRMEREWEVTLEERLDRSTRTQLERITPELRVTSSGEQWFDLEVGYSGSGGERFSAADIQQLLRGGGPRKLKNGRFALLDTGAVEELQEILVDCAPAGQRAGSDGAVSYRLGQAQAGFLDSSLQAQGLELQAPTPWKDHSRRQTGALELTCPPLGTLDPVLRPYQKQGVAWLRFLRDSAFGGVLADEMGLGKTLQVLAHLRTLQTDRPHLVVCPTSLVFNWAAEAARFTPERPVVVLNGPDRHRRFDGIPAGALVITSYALIRRDLDRHRALEYDTVILDEAQHIKNRSTQNAVAVKALRSRHRLVLTGTPMENSVLDLWSLLDFLMPGHLGTAQDFRERYELPITKERDAATLARLSRRIRPFLLRRLKREVVKDLPAKLEQVSFCELNEEQTAVYQQLLAATRQQVEKAVGAQGLAASRLLVLTALLRLRQVCCDLRLLNRPAPATDAADATDPVGSDLELPPALPESKPGKPATNPTPSGKLQLFGELLDEIVDGGHRVLVFSQFTTMLGLLQEELEARQLPFCYLDGSTKDRGAVVQRFQKEESVPVFLISLKAGGVGLNLTGADTVIHFDPWWNPAVEDQATDRAHRLGQTRVVTSYKLITRGTVEEKILALQGRKRELIGALLTGEQAFTQSLTWEEIQELLA